VKSVAQPDAVPKQVDLPLNAREPEFRAAVTSTAVVRTGARKVAATISRADRSRLISLARAEPICRQAADVVARPSTIAASSRRLLRGKSIFDPLPPPPWDKASHLNRQ
jgi:hypothetical protein